MWSGPGHQTKTIRVTTSSRFNHMEQNNYHFIGFVLVMELGTASLVIWKNNYHFPVTEANYVFKKVDRPVGHKQLVNEPYTGGWLASGGCLQLWRSLMDTFSYSDSGLANSDCLVEIHWCLSNISSVVWSQMDKFSCSGYGLPCTASLSCRVEVRYANQGIPLVFSSALVAGEPPPPPPAGRGRMEQQNRAEQEQRRAERYQPKPPGCRDLGPFHF